MATTNSPATFPGLFKEVYEESGLIDALPATAVLQDRIKFSEADMTGDKFVFGVILQYENGISYAPSSGSNTTVTLNSPVSGYVGRAQVEGSQIILRSQMDYPTASKAANGGKRAFAQAYSALMENMKSSMAKRVELSLLYGRSGWGKVLTNTSGALVLTTASWQAGIWVGMTGAVLEAFTATTASATQHDTDLTIASITPSTRTVTVTGTSSSVVANDHLYPKSARTTTGFNECLGIDGILSATTTYQNIDPATYDLWRAQSDSTSAPLNLTRILQAVALAVPYGLTEEDVVCLVPPKAFAALANNEAAFRQYDSSYSKTKSERGARGIRFHSENGEIEIVSHPFVKEGEAFILPLSQVKRTGSSDITMGLPGWPDFVFNRQDVNSWEARLYSDQAPVILKPAQCVKLSNITYA